MREKVGELEGSVKALRAREAAKNSEVAPSLDCIKRHHLVSSIVQGRGEEGEKGGEFWLQLVRVGGLENVS